MTWESFSVADFDICPCLHCTKAVYLPSFSIITFPKVGDNHCFSSRLAVYAKYLYLMADELCKTEQILFEKCTSGQI